SETRVRVVCRAKSRFPRLLERLRKRETEWSDWKEASRAQGRCATRLRYAPTSEALLILNHFSSDQPFRNSLSARNCIKTPVHCTFPVSKPFASLACRLIFSRASHFICSFSPRVLPPLGNYRPN